MNNVARNDAYKRAAIKAWEQAKKALAALRATPYAEIELRTEKLATLLAQELKAGLEETLSQQRLNLKTVRDARPSATHHGFIIDPICC
ncbi:MAG: hypothetical protein AABN33_23035 [Acidobacteriota bacterium]